MFQKYERKEQRRTEVFMKKAWSGVEASLDKTIILTISVHSAFTT